MVMNGKKYGRYSPELKKRAVGLAEEIGATRAAPILGINPTLLSMWIGQHRSGSTKYMTRQEPPEVKALHEAKREIHKLKRENEDLKKANMILKELATVFSKDHPNTSSEWSLNSTNKKNQK